MLTIALNMSDQSFWNSTTSTILSGGCVAIITALMTIGIQKFSRFSEDKLHAKNIIKYINTVLLLEASKLISIQKHLEIKIKITQGSPGSIELTHGYFEPPNLAVSLSEKEIEKFLASELIAKNKKHTNVIQHLIEAQSAYTKCAAMITYYNDECINHEKLVIMEGLKGEPREIVNTYIMAANDTLNNIKICQESSFTINQNAMRSLQDFYQEIFPDETNLPRPDADNVVKSEEL